MATVIVSSGVTSTGLFASGTWAEASGREFSSPEKTISYYISLSPIFQTVVTTARSPSIFSSFISHVNWADFTLILANLA